MEIEVRDQQVSVFMWGNWTIEGVEQRNTEYCTGNAEWEPILTCITFSGFKMVYS